MKFEVTQDVTIDLSEYVYDIAAWDDDDIIEFIRDIDFAVADSQWTKKLVEAAKSWIEE